jgi:1-acyl-sn-glycerol-3-phosphate acyltransferase
VEAALRRLVTIPGYAALFVLGLGLLPLALPVALVSDLLRGSRGAATRSLLFFLHYLACELAGMAASLGLWLAGRLHRGLSQERYARCHHRLQRWWARSLLAGAVRCFGMRVEVEGDTDLGSGPWLVFVRHVSVGDTVLPAVLLSDRHDVRLRYVLKRELLWDPCLDIVGNRLPNVFVRRGSEDSAREIDAVGRLAEDLEGREGVLIYPEGTRFDEAKRARILEKLRGKDAALHQRAQRLHRVLPPRPGGVLELMERRPDADVLLCAHAGFEGAARFSEFMRGGLVGARISVAFWRVPAASLPRERGARLEWLYDQWERVDAWVAAHRQAAP